MRLRYREDCDRNQRRIGLKDDGEASIIEGRPACIQRFPAHDKRARIRFVSPQRKANLPGRNFQAIQVGRDMPVSDAIHLELCLQHISPAKIGCAKDLLIE